MNTAGTAQQPVAWIDDQHKPQPHCVTDLKFCSMADYEAGKHLLYTPLYGAPCQRERLTDDDIWRSTEIMAINARAGLMMPLLMELARAIEHLVHGERAAPAEQPAPTDTLCQRLQYQCSEWGAYWAAPDAHGVELSIEQAAELLRTALGVDVEIKS